MEHALNLVGNDLLVSGEYIRIARRASTCRPPRSSGTTVGRCGIARVDERIPWRPGVRELLAALREADVPVRR